MEHGINPVSLKLGQMGFALVAFAGFWLLFYGHIFSLILAEKICTSKRNFRHLYKITKKMEYNKIAAKEVVEETIKNLTVAGNLPARPQSTHDHCGRTTWILMGIWYN
jgi:hypothetical protein